MRWWRTDCLIAKAAIEVPAVIAKILTHLGFLRSCEAVKLRRSEAIWSAKGSHIHRNRRIFRKHRVIAR